MAPKVAGLTGATLETAPSVCHECVWWQSRGVRNVDKRRWIQKAEEEWGAWGTVYYDADGRLLGSMQYGPSGLFPRARELPAGPPSPEAVLVTCAYVVDSATPWVMQSLFLAAIGDAKDRGAKALEAFAYRYAEGESTYERFLVHRTVFPSDFLADFGFRTLRVQGRVELARLELGGLSRCTKGCRHGLPGAEGGADAGARAAAALIEPGVPGGAPRSARSTSSFWSRSPVTASDAQAGLQIDVRARNRTSPVSGGAAARPVRAVRRPVLRGRPGAPRSGSR